MCAKRAIIFIIFLCFHYCYVSRAQELPATQDLFKASVLLSPGFSYEKKIGRLQTLVVHGYMATTAQLGWSSSIGNTSHIYFDPAISFAYRYYYNLDRREHKGRSTLYNNGNYVSVITAHSISKSRLDEAFAIENKRRLVNTFGILYGIQRNYRSRFSLDIKVGLGYKYGSSSRLDGYGNAIRSNEAYLRLLADVGIGFWLGTRRD